MSPTAQETVETVETKLVFAGMTLLEKLRSNTEVHGLNWAATQFKRSELRKGKIANFDVFYYACFGRFPRK